MPCISKIVLDDLALESVDFYSVLKSLGGFDCFISFGRLFHHTAPL